MMDHSRSVICCVRIAWRRSGGMIFLLGAFLSMMDGWVDWWIVVVIVTYCWIRWALWKSGRHFRVARGVNANHILIGK